jgi:RNA polymerase sigma factor (sigma-70 family)
MTGRAQTRPATETLRSLAWDAVVAIELEAGQRLFGYARRSGIDDDRAGDIVQVALLRLARELSRGVVVRSPEAWLYTAITRLAMDEHRIDRRVLRLAARLGERMRPAIVEIDAADRIALWLQVDRLPTRQRQAVYLRYHADLSFEEIAGVMGVTSSAARSYATKGIATVRTSLGQDPREAR